MKMRFVRWEEGRKGGMGYPIAKPAIIRPTISVAMFDPPAWSEHPNSAHIHPTYTPPLTSAFSLFSLLAIRKEEGGHA